MAKRDLSIYRAPDDVTSLLKRRERAMSRKANWRDLLDTTYSYFLPNRNVWNRQTTPGENLNADVYDSSGPLGLRKFVNRMINALTPPDQNWVSFVAGTEIPEESVEEVNLQLQNITDTFFFYLRQSNFDLVIHEAFTDMAISTGVMQANEGSEDEPLIFSAIPSDTVAYDSGPRGDLSAFYRDWGGITADHAFHIWGEEFLIPEQLKNRDKPIEMDLYEISYYDFVDKIYKYLVIEKSSKQVVYFKVEESWEWIGFRWAKLAGEDSGRGPAIDAMPTVATINKAVADELKSAALKANPPYMAFTDTVINPWTFKIAPNEVIPVNPTGTGTWPIAPLPGGGDISFTAIVINDLRAQVADIMMAQPTQPIQNGPVRTATEVISVQNDLRENAGAQFIRVQTELFDPLVRRVLWILQRKGLIPELIIDGKQVSLNYLTPLSLSKNETDLQKFMLWYQAVATVLGPEAAIGVINAPKFPRWSGEKAGAELDLIKDEQEIITLLQQAQEAAKDAIDGEQPGPEAAGAAAEGFAT